MANSKRVTELSAYKGGETTNLEIEPNDAFLIASKYNGVENASYQISYDQLYNAILARISADLKSTWENPAMIQTSSDVYASIGDVDKGLGVGVGIQVLEELKDLRNHLSMALWS